MFRGFTGSLLAAACRVACPLTDLTGHFAQPTGTFTPELPASRSPFSSSGMTTVATERFHRWDFHPLERQLASLHGLFHPLQHAGLSGALRIARDPGAICIFDTAITGDQVRQGDLTFLIAASLGLKHFLALGEFDKL